MPTAEARLRRKRRAASGPNGLPKAPPLVGNWQRDALCLGRFELFLSEDKVDQDVAKAICEYCPVLDHCEQFTKRVTPRPVLGVWAGRVYSGHYRPDA